MPYFGAHMSVSGGLYKAIERIMAVDGTALQIFSRNQRQWNAKPISTEEAVQFAAAWKTWGAYPICVHASYLINIATPDAEAQKKTLVALSDELKRTEALGIGYVVLHPGAALQGSTASACTRAAALIAEAVHRSGTHSVTLLLENTAGQGTALGGDFTQIATILDESGLHERAGMCLDTAHAFAAGYDMRTDAGVAAMLDALDGCVGIARLRFMHINDSKTECGSRVDRHAHIGEGHIGLEGFAGLVHDARLRSMPMVLETPKDETLEDDRRNLDVLRKLYAGERG